MTEDFSILDQFEEVIAATLTDTIRKGWAGSYSPRTPEKIFGTLRNIVAELISARDQGLLEDMPLTMRSNIHQTLSVLLHELTYVRTQPHYITQMIARVDQMHEWLWSGGFRFRGGKIPGFEAKVQQANNINVVSARIRALEVTSIDSRDKLQTLVDEVIAIADQSKRNLDQAQQLFQSLNSIHQSGEAKLVELNSITNRAQQLENDSKESSNEADSSATLAARHESRISEFVAIVKENEERLDSTIRKSEIVFKELQSSSRSFQEDKEAQVADLLRRLEETEKDIVVKLSKATGYTLFHSFNQRQESIRGHWAWLVAATICLILGVGAGVMLLYNVKEIGPAFFIKLGFALPTAVVVGFCLKQFNRERRLKEEYAFKSALSLSLQPYQSLVNEASSGLEGEAKHIYANFLVRSIDAIFDSPTDKVFGEKRLGGATDTKIVASFIKQIKDVKETFDGK